MSTSHTIQNPKLLTAKQNRFAEMLFQGYSQRQAYVTVYKPVSVNTNNLDVAACRIANSSKISLRVRELFERSADTAVASVDERKLVLSEILRGRAGHYINPDGTMKDDINLNSAALQEVKKTEFTGGKGGRAKESTTTLKLRDPVTAISELNKMERLYSVAPEGNDNRQWNIIVYDKETKDLLAKIGDRTGRQTLEIPEDIAARLGAGRDGESAGGDAPRSPETQAVDAQ